MAGEKAARTQRFVKNRNGDTVLGDASLARARRLVGPKGYVANIDANLMGAGEVTASYHDLREDLGKPRRSFPQRPGASRR